MEVTSFKLTYSYSIYIEFQSVTSSFRKLFHSNLYTAAVRTCAKFQIASINESEDREA